jgi:hypothetical protein
VTAPSVDGWRVIFVQGDGDAYCSMLNVLVNSAGDKSRDALMHDD